MARHPSARWPLTSALASRTRRLGAALVLAAAVPYPVQVEKSLEATMRELDRLLALDI